jgi:hypothetical protein
MQSECIRGLPGNIRQHLSEIESLKGFETQLFHANAFKRWARKRVQGFKSLDLDPREKHINASRTQDDLAGHKTYSSAVTSKEVKSTWLQRARLWYWLVPELELPTKNLMARFAGHKASPISFDNPIKVIKQELAVTKYRSLARRILTKGQFPPFLLGMDPASIL